MIKVDAKDFLSQERLEKEQALKFKSMLTEENLLNLGKDPEEISRYVEIDGFINTDTANRQHIIDELARARSFFGKGFKTSNEQLFLRFLRFMALKLPEKNVVFNIKKGLITYKTQGRRKGPLISVKDPFLKNENHGIYLQSENKFNRLIFIIKEFIMETSKGRIEEVISSRMQAEVEEEEKTNI